jgi:hypothetical protein
MSETERRRQTRRDLFVWSLGVAALVIMFVAGYLQVA